MEIEMIHESLLNGQRKQMIEQIQEYGLYAFWSDYKAYLRDICIDDDYSNLHYFMDATISYFRITEQ